MSRARGRTTSFPKCKGTQRKSPSRVLAVLFGLAGLLAGTSGCESLLNVDNPRDVLSEDLRSPQAAPVLLQGVIGDFNWTYTYAHMTSGYFSNELIHTGSASGWRELERGSVPPAGTGASGTLYDRASRAAWVAQNAVEVFREVFDDADRREGTARALIYRGFALFILADNYCVVTLNASAPLQPSEVYARAEGHFTEALAIAQAAGSQRATLEARAGRARARLFTGDYQGAAQDAAGIPDGWEMLAVFSENSARENNFVATQATDQIRKEGGINPRFYQDPRYRQDPRFGMIDQGPTFTGEDRIRQFVEQTRYPTRATNARVHSWQEARLIQAEAEVRMGNLNEGVALLNALRAPDEVAPYDGPLTADGILEEILYDRSVILFLEAKHLADLRRTNHPLLEGRDRCLPLSQAEQQSNPNLG